MTDCSETPGTGMKHHVLETDTATVEFTGSLQQGDCSDSDSSSACADVEHREPVISEHEAQNDLGVYSGTDVDQNQGRVQSEDTSNLHTTDRSVDNSCNNAVEPNNGQVHIGENSSDAVFTHPVRTNPFTKDDYTEQDPFSSDIVIGSNNNYSTSISNCQDSLSNPELPIKEDYFSLPEDHIELMSVEDLEKAISDCKQQVVLAEPGSNQKRNLTHQLILLRLKLSDAKERLAHEEEGLRLVTGHLFLMKVKQRSRRYCEQCSAAIWGVMQTWYRCKNCGFCCHEKCLDLVRRTCAYVKMQDNPEYIMMICPERTLASQNYKCAECRTDISFHTSQSEPRLCDYTGYWYCSQCHWNDYTVIPARVLHNWDFETRKVCRASKQFLKLMQKRAVLRVIDINPMLFNFVEELSDVKKLREEILIMKQYFLRCKGALKSKLLLQLKDRQHFVDNSDMYSLADLQDVANDVLLPELVKIHASFAQHIKTDCSFCQAKGSVCGLCDDRELLFPFDAIAIVCSVCSSVLHRHCYMTNNQRCPNCSLNSDSEY